MNSNQIPFPSPEQSELERPLAVPDSVPAEGIHHNVSSAEYHAWPVLSQSLLKIGVSVSWARVRQMLDGRVKHDPPDAMVFGSAVHCWLFERDTFADRFPISAPCSAILKSGDRKGSPCCGNASYRVGDAWFCGKHVSDDCEQVVDFVTPDEMARIKQMTAALMASPAAKLLWHPGGQEIAWTAVLDGVPMKGKLDRWCPEMTAPDGSTIPGLIIDVKKMPVGNGSLSTLQSTIRNRQYDLQAATYVRAMETLTGKRPVYVWLFIEDSEPFDVAAVQASSSMMALGFRKLDKALGDARDCLSSGYWPGYADPIGSDLAQIGPSDWELRSWGLSHLTGDAGEWL